MCENIAKLLEKYNFTYKICDDSVSVVTDRAGSHVESCGSLPAEETSPISLSSSNSTRGLLAGLEAFTGVDVNGYIVAHDIAVVEVLTATP